MLRSVLVLFTGTLYTQILSLLTGLIVIKMLSLEEYGVYAVIASFINIIITPLSRFFSLAIKRYIPLYRKEGNARGIKGLINLAFWYVMVFTGLFTILLILFASPILKNVLKIDTSYTGIYILYIMGLLPMTLSPLFSAILLGFEKFREYTYSVNLFPNGGRFIYTLLWWLLLPLKMVGAITGIILKNTINLVLALWYLRSELRSLHKVRASYNVREWVLFSLPYSLKFLVNYASQNIGVILLGNMKTVSDAGIFRIANFLVMAIYGLSTSFSGVVLPRLSRAISEDKSHVESIINRASFQNFAITSALILIAAVAAKPFLMILGEEYTSSYKVILILSFMLLFESWSFPWQDMLVASRRTDWILISHIFASISSIISSFFLIRYMGISGAAAGIVVESIVAFAFRLYWMRKLGIKMKVMLDSRIIMIFLLISSIMFLLLTLS